MSEVSPEDRRLFVRDAAAQLATAATVTLNTETAAGLSEICQTLMSKAERAAAPVIAHFIGECKNLCAAILKGAAPYGCAEADEILKTCFAAVRSCLFSMALGDVADASKGQFDRLEARICELTCEQLAQHADSEKMVELRVIPPLPPVAAAEKARLAEAEHQAFEPAFDMIPGPVTKKATPAEKLMQSIARLTEKALRDSELRDMAFEVASAARAAHSFRFGMVCRNVETDTPDALLDENHARAVREQLAFWLRGGADSKAVASLRQVGGALWIELRQNTTDGRPAHDGTPPNQAVQGVSVIEDYISFEGAWIRRARLDLLLPTFRAYEVCYGHQTFLVPIGDVESVIDVPSKELETVSFSKLLDLPADWKPLGTDRIAIVARWRGKSTILEAELVNGPKTFLARNVSDAGPHLRGIAGVARLDDGRRAAVLDLYPWLETYSERAIEQRKQEALLRLGEEKYMVFRVAGRRYSVPMSAVRAVGRVDNEALLMSMVDTKRGAFHLRDIKEALGLEGEAGGVYVVIESAVNGSVAWVVDGVEPVYVVAPEMTALGATLRLAPFGYAHRGGKVQGLIRGILPAASAPCAPVYLLDVDLLIPSGRPLRRIS